MKPTIGRVVYFKNKLTVTAAVITYVYDDDKMVDLFVMYRDHHANVICVDHGEEVGQWDWMPFQKQQSAAQPEPANTATSAGVQDQVAKVADSKPKKPAPSKE